MSDYIIYGIEEIDSIEIIVNYFDNHLDKEMHLSGVLEFVIFLIERICHTLKPILILLQGFRIRDFIERGYDPKVNSYLSYLSPLYS